MQETDALNELKKIGATIGNSVGKGKEKRLLENNFTVENGLFESNDIFVPLSAISMVQRGRSTKSSYWIPVILFLLGCIFTSSRNYRTLGIIMIVVGLVILVALIYSNLHRDYLLFIRLHNGDVYTMAHSDPEFLWKIKEALKVCINDMSKGVSIDLADSNINFISGDGNMIVNGNINLNGNGNMVGSSGVSIGGNAEESTVANVTGGETYGFNSNSTIKADHSQTNYYESFMLNIKNNPDWDDWMKMQVYLEGRRNAFAEGSPEAENIEKIMEKVVHRDKRGFKEVARTLGLDVLKSVLLNGVPRPVQVVVAEIYKRLIKG